MSVSFYQKMWQTISRGGIWQGELVNRRKDGALYDAALTIAPVFDLNGEIGGYVGVQRDISNQKEIDRMKDEFVSNVSHELRTPIANVKLYISLLTRGKPEKHDEYLQTLRREAARLEKLIEDLLDLSRLDAGLVALNLDGRAIAELLEAAGAAFKLLAEEKGITLSVNPPASSMFWQGRDAAEKIKYFIKAAIEKWGIRYVLLIGGRSNQGSEEMYWVVLSGTVP